MWVGNENPVSPSTRTTPTMSTTTTTTRTRSKPPTSSATCRPLQRRHRITSNHRFCRQKTSLALNELFHPRAFLKTILTTKVFQVPEIRPQLQVRPTSGRPDLTITPKMFSHPYFPLRHRQRRKSCRQGKNCWVTCPFCQIHLFIVLGQWFSTFIVKKIILRGPHLFVVINSLWVRFWDPPVEVSLCIVIYPKCLITGLPKSCGNKFYEIMKVFMWKLNF